MRTLSNQQIEGIFLIVCFAIMPLFILIPMQLTPKSQSPLAFQKRVFAFYYSWYGNSTDYTNPVYNITDFSPSGWAHWNEGGFNPPNTIASTDYPKLGAYDCSDPELIKAHFSMAENAGIDGFICTWWGINHDTDIAFNNILNMANNVTPNLNFTIYFESYQERFLKLSAAERESAMIQEIVYILRTYSTNPYFLKINGIPVIFIYLTYSSPFSIWRNVITRVRQEFACYFIGDIVPTPAVKDELVQIFDGIHIYNPTTWIEYQRVFTGSSNWDMTPIYVNLGQSAHSHNKLFAATVIPGYNDTIIRDPGIVIQRNGLQTYDTLWNSAIQASADWVLITSFNEWHEGTEIESSREYNNLYLNRTQYWTNIFHALE
ncbi:MAG: glycoside hydrolase family 99-like domain-containing protein [Candidatus Helarchaeota archaeon]